MLERLDEHRESILRFTVEELLRYFVDPKTGYIPLRKHEIELADAKAEKAQVVAVEAQQAVVKVAPIASQGVQKSAQKLPEPPIAVAELPQYKLPPTEEKFISRTNAARQRAAQLMDGQKPDPRDQFILNAAEYLERIKPEGNKTAYEQLQDDYLNKKWPLTLEETDCVLVGSTATESQAHTQSALYPDIPEVMNGSSSIYSYSSLATRGASLLFSAPSMALTFVTTATTTLTNATTTMANAAVDMATGVDNIELKKDKLPVAEKFVVEARTLIAADKLVPENFHLTISSLKKTIKTYLENLKAIRLKHNKNKEGMLEATLSTWNSILEWLETPNIQELIKLINGLEPELAVKLVETDASLATIKHKLFSDLFRIVMLIKIDEEAFAHGLTTGRIVPEGTASAIVEKNFRVIDSLSSKSHEVMIWQSSVLSVYTTIDEEKNKLSRSEGYSGKIISSISEFVARSPQITPEKFLGEISVLLKTYEKSLESFLPNRYGM